jgi:HrpA-like RNA helicase
MTLPIEAALPDLKRTLAAARSAVLEAPTGAGKTTMVPLALLGEPWAKGKKILMLEPRRVAARAAAARMADLLGEKVGETVGYRVRLDAKVSAKTRIEVVTEGLLTRRLQADPELKGVACVIFDEFHERSLNADLGLALTLETQAALNDDLKILVMSATLDGARVAKLVDGPVVRSEGRLHPPRASNSRRRTSYSARCTKPTAAFSSSCRAKAKSAPSHACSRRKICPAQRYCRSTARCPRTLKIARSAHCRVHARSCLRQRSPKPASPSKTCAW